MALALRRYTGTVSTWDYRKGFGYVRVDAPILRAFCPMAELPPHVGMDEIGKGTRLEFYLEAHANGPRCIRVNII